MMHAYSHDQKSYASKLEKWAKNNDDIYGIRRNHTLICVDTLQADINSQLTLLVQSAFLHAKFDTIQSTPENSSIQQQSTNVWMHACMHAHLVVTHGTPRKHVDRNRPNLQRRLEVFLRGLYPLCSAH